MGNHLHDGVSFNPATKIQLCLERCGRLASGVCHRTRCGGSDLLSRSRRAQAIWSGDAVFRNDNSLRRRFHHIDSLRKFVAGTARLHSQRDRCHMLSSNYSRDGAFPSARRRSSSQSRLRWLMAQRFLLCRTAGGKCATSRPRTHHCFASPGQRELLSIVSVGLPYRVRCCPCSPRCFARVPRITATRLLRLEVAATCSTSSSSVSRIQVRIPAHSPLDSLGKRLNGELTETV